MNRVKTEILGRVIFALRRRKNLTQTKVSKAGGVSNARISALEKGQNDPKLTTILAVAQGLGTSASTLIGIFESVLQRVAEDTWIEDDEYGVKQDAAVLPIVYSVIRDSGALNPVSLVARSTMADFERIGAFCHQVKRGPDWGDRHEDSSSE